MWSSSGTSHWYWPKSDSSALFMVRVRLPVCTSDWIWCFLLCSSSMPSLNHLGIWITMVHVWPKHSSDNINMSECNQLYLTDGKGVDFVEHLNCMSWPFTSCVFCSLVVKLGGTVGHKPLSTVLSIFDKKDKLLKFLSMSSLKEYKYKIFGW